MGPNRGPPRAAERKVKTRSMTGDCQFTGYKPGGGDTVISPITAPTAKLQENQLDNIVTIGKEGAGLSETAVSSITEFTKKMRRVGPRLAQSFGIVGALIGGFAELTSPGPEDVIDAVNKAISDLTDEASIVNYNLGHLLVHMRNMAKKCFSANVPKVFIFGLLRQVQ